MSTSIKAQIPQELQEIAPYDDSVYHEKMASLVEQPLFEHAVKYVMPDVDYSEFKKVLLAVKNQHDFQYNIMGPFLEKLAKATTDGITISGIEHCDPNKAYTYISNHRDIVLDASFLNLCFIREHMPLTQVAIGNNLLIFEWITDLVKINRSFIVKRDVPKLQAVDAAKQLSAYIHFTINEWKEPVWIAQRQGRAKDSNDVTQDSLVKMLSFGGEDSTKENLMSINICPVSISYEYDPNDYLKAREFLLRRRDPEYKKTQRDDLFSMETGLLSAKGRVHFHLGECINDELAKITETSRNAIIRRCCEIIDREIHLGYKIYPCNYISYDKLNRTDRFKGCYTAEEEAGFEDYLSKQLAKVDVPDVTPEEYEFMRELVLNMYANPLKNHLIAKES
jgi:hypothetical protein